MRAVSNDNGRPFYDASKVEAAAKGRWGEIFTTLAPNSLFDAVDKLGKHVTCPVHGTSNKNGNGDGFRLIKNQFESGRGYCNSCGNKGDGFQVLMWVNNDSYYNVVTEVGEYLGVEPDKYLADRKPQNHNKPKPTPQIAKPGPSNQNVVSIQNSPRPSAQQIEKAKLKDKNNIGQVADNCAKDKERIKRIWSESRSLANAIPGPILRFWRRRNVLLRPQRILEGENLRFHPELPYYDEDENGQIQLVGKFPAIVSAIKDLEGNIITLHRTYLTPSGDKANVPSARKMVTVPSDRICTGNAIQLGGQPKGSVLAVAEGLETAMSAMKAYSAFPTWSCVNATLLENFNPPKGVKTLLVWGDKDLSLTGQNSSHALKARLEPKGIKVHVLIPNRAIETGSSIDWNDIMMNEGRWGFPAWALIKNMIGNV